jgi:cytochrome P450
MEMRSLFGQLVDRIDWVERAGDPQWVEANFVGGLKSLPIRYQMKTLQPS